MNWRKARDQRFKVGSHVVIARSRRQRKSWNGGRLEQLETRSLLAGDVASPWQNPVDRFDVNADGKLSVMDVLVVVDDLNSFGVRDLRTVQISGPSPISDEAAGGFVDVDGNGRVTPADVLALIDAIEVRDADDIVSFIVTPTDAAGVPITSVNVNDPFFLEVKAQDLRAATAARGVQSAYLDLLYTSTLVSVDGTIQFGADFPNGRQGDTTTAGVVDELGAFNITRTDDQPRILARIPMRATAAGTATFTADPKENASTEVLLHARTPLADIPVQNIDFGSSTLTIVGPQLPQISIQDSSVVEGNSGTTEQRFTVRLSAASTSTVTVNYATLSGTALPDDDFIGATGVVTFNPGQVEREIAVSVFGDLLDESNETYSVLLSSPVGAEIADGTAVGTIQDDDATPTLSINDVQVVEGNSGLSAMVFTVTLSAASGQDVTVDFATSNGTALGGSDFQSNSGNVRFAPGELTQTITVQVNGDTALESDETFNVTLSSSVNATLAKSVGVGTILNDDEPGVEPLVRIRAEATNATGTPINTVTVGDTFFLNVFVDDLRTGEEALGVFSAYADIEFQAARADVNGPFAFAAIYPNGRSQNATVDGLIDDVGATGNLTPTLGPDEVLMVRIPMVAQTAGLTTFLPNPADDSLLTTRLFGISNPLTVQQIEFSGDELTIQPAVALPTLSIADASIQEGNTGTRLLNFPVTLSSAATQTVTFNFATSSGSAIAGSDYQSTAGVGTINAGQTSFTVSVPIFGDTNVEANENFTVTITNLQGATLLDGTATGTIVNDDQATGGSGRIAGLVFADTNNDGAVTGLEPGIDGVTVRLIGIGSSSSFIAREVQTNANGQFEFVNVPAGSYELREVQSVYFMDGKDFITGGNPGVVGNDFFSSITVRDGDNLNGYHFGEWGLKAQFISRKLFLTSFARADWTSTQLARVGSLFAFDEGVDGDIDVVLQSAAGGRVGLQVLNSEGQVIGGASSPFGQVKMTLEDTNGAPIILRVTGAAEATLSLQHDDVAAALAVDLALAEEGDD